MKNNLIRGLPTTYSSVYQGNEAVSLQQAVRLTQDSVRGLATKEYVDNSAESVDTSDLATREYVGDSVSELATRKYVDDSISFLVTTNEIMVNKKATHAISL